MGPNQENRGRRGQGVLTSALLTLQAEQFLVCVWAGGGRRGSCALQEAQHTPGLLQPDASGILPLAMTATNVSRHCHMSLGTGGRQHQPPVRTTGSFGGGV